MKKTFLIFLTVVALASCMKEKAVTIDHPLVVEYPASDLWRTDTVAFLDLRGTSVTPEEVLSAFRSCRGAGLVLAAVNADMDGAPAAQWMKENMAEWGHGRCYTAMCGACAFTGSCRDAAESSFEAFSLKDGAALVAGWHGVNYAAAAADEEDVAAIVSMIRREGGDWVLALDMDAPSRTLYLSAFTECIKAGFGEYSSTGNYLYAGPGTWDRLDCISASPMIFSVRSKKEGE